MFGLNLIEVITILGFIVGLPTVYIAVRNYYRQKPIFKYMGCKYYDDDKTIMYWKFKISNVTVNGFVLNKVLIKKHLFLFYYINRTELIWQPNYHYHTSSNPFEENDIIKSNMDINIVVRNEYKNNFNKKYFYTENSIRKVKFFFITSLKKYKIIVPKNSLIDTYQPKIKFKPINSVSTLNIDDISTNKGSNDINKLINELQKPIIDQGTIAKLISWKFRKNK